MTREKFNHLCAVLWQPLISRAAEQGYQDALLEIMDPLHPADVAKLAHSVAEIEKYNAEIQAAVKELIAPWPAVENEQRMVESNDECMELAAGFATSSSLVN